ncbi:hypothetical protein [Sinomonas sp. G460-2]|uniref:hypothetical protein n=1 Tax=Sinomonas sp. G460-2 TaxID=3393464 RepID=UPI0039EE7786
MNVLERLVELTEFAKIGGWTLETTPDAAFAATSGDSNDYCFMKDGQYILQQEERGTLLRPEFISPEIDCLEKFLTFRYGPDVRRKCGMSRKYLRVDPIEIDETRNGFHFSGEIKDVHVTWTDHEGAHRVSGLRHFEAARFSVYARYDAGTIRQSFLREDGHPLFTAHE